MFGTNKPRKREQHSGSLLQVHDVWYTVQGEGPFMGFPATFVRLSGCTLSCFWCDTIWNDETDPRQPVPALVDRILAVTPKNCDLIVLTGGEPLRQPLGEFFRYLCDRWTTERGGPPTVQIETSGTAYDPIIEDPRVVVVCSPKTPVVDERVARVCRHYKYVLRVGEVAEDDGLPNVSTQRPGDRAGVKLYRPGAAAPFGTQVYVSPCDEYFTAGEPNPEATAANYRLVRDVAMRFGYRVSLQMHKHIEAA